MKIGKAVDYLAQGRKVTRSIWAEAGISLSMQVPDKNSKMTLPYVYLETKDGSMVPWSINQPDLLADDWQVLKE